MPDPAGPLTPDALRAFCLAQPDAVEEFPFDERTSVFKVRGKVFALSALTRPPLRVSLKCDPELAIQQRLAHPEIGPGYHLNKRHWNTIDLTGALPAGVVADLIEDSYDLVVAGLPKAVRKALAIRRAIEAEPGT